MCPKLGFPSGSAVKNHKESDTTEQLSVHARVPNTVGGVDPDSCLVWPPGGAIHQ